MDLADTVSVSASFYFNQGSEALFIYIQSLLGRFVRNAIDVCQHLGDYLVKLSRDLFTEIDAGESGCQSKIFMDWNVVLARFRQDVFGQ